MDAAARVAADRYTGGGVLRKAAALSLAPRNRRG